MAQTVTEVLTAATDSVTLINAVSSGTYNVTWSDPKKKSTRWYSVMLTTLSLSWLIQTQMSQVTHQISLSYTGAITTGKAYIAAN
jgi:hypothetical protein